MTKSKKSDKKETSKENVCNDVNCFVHGNLKTRGRTFVGQVVSSKAHKTILVEWERRVFIPKYERKLKKKTKIAVHVPPCMNIKEGDIVKIQECRPISKTKSFTVIETLGKNILFEEEKSLKDEGKFKKTKKEIKNVEKSQKEKEDSQELDSKSAESEKQLSENDEETNDKNKQKENSEEKSE